MNDAVPSIPIIPREALFGNPEKSGAQIAKDGRHIAWLAPLDGVMNVFVAPRTALQDARPLTRETGRKIQTFAWARDSQHVLVYKDKDGDEDWHVYAVDLATATMRDLTPYPAINAGIAGSSRKHPGAVLITHNKRDPRFPDLFRVDVATGAETLLAENPGFAGFMTDDDFTVRFAEKMNGDGSSVALLPDGAGGWTEWLHIPAEDALTSGITDKFSPDGKTTLMKDSRGRDTAALMRLDLETQATTLLAADPRADIGGLITDPVSHAPLAYSVDYDRARWVALDPAIQPDLDFLNGAGIGDWGISSRTDDDTLWVVGAQSDTAPGAAYLYDRPAKTLEKLYDARPALADSPLAPMRPEIIPSRDGLNLVSYLTIPRFGAAPHPLVLAVHGGPWSRDSFGYHPYHQWLANRGYAVLSVNFRSSTGFGKAFLNAGDHQWGGKMDDDLLDAVDWAVGAGVADPARIAIFGGSYGGYAVLAGMTRNPTRYTCGVDIVGPSNLETLLATIPPYWEAFRAQLIKSLGDPDTAEGAALLRDRSPVHRAEALARPLLIGQGANDPRVKQAESDQMVAALQRKNIPVTYVLFPDEGHGFARPENNIAFNAVVEKFLAVHLGGRAEPPAPGEIERSTAQFLAGGI
jgi:dipeptidyl aminopeptidase/acylaminoacyl peptidase